MKRIGITGQSGFIGSHLFNTIRLYPEKYVRIPFDDNYYNNPDELLKFARSCDVIIHLAGMNRHPDPMVIYNTNILLTSSLIDALEKNGSRPHVIFSSSTQEERDNLYGKSKKEGREMLVNWAEKNGGSFTGLVIPNVFGPFGMPYYNSVVATFCHQLTHDEQPKIDVDSEVNLIYVGELVRQIIREIDHTLPGTVNKRILLNPDTTIKVSDILNKLESYKTDYLKNSIIPEIDNSFDINLFNTYRSYIDHKSHFPVSYKLNTDDRGDFVEVMKLKTGGQVSYSTTKPGITRGNHYHTRKIERFAVIKGKAKICLRKVDKTEIAEFIISGDEPAFVDMPVWYTHNITNIGDENLTTLFWINEFYNPDDPDTFFETV
jgi:UDP-2-acetamido-2,6-beta-L-arabino-hexul-4-ose reductase